MKPLKESIFDSVENITSNDNALIEQFLKDNYEISGSYTIKDGVVDAKGQVKVKNTNIESLTNGIFRFGKIKGGFYCVNCKNLTSLEGSPKEVSGDFCCWNCRSLVSLKGAPEKVGMKFWCRGCNSLTSLEGSPKEVGGDFDCSYCKNLKSLEGAPEKVGQEFRCSNCPGLTSLEGAPKEVNWSFVCSRCENLTSLKGAKKVGEFIVCAKCPKLITTGQDRKKYKLKYTSEE